MLPTGFLDLNGDQIDTIVRFYINVAVDSAAGKSAFLSIWRKVSWFFLNLIYALIVSESQLFIRIYS